MVSCVVPWAVRGRYREFMQQVGADPSTNATLPCDLANETWVSALFDQVTRPKHSVRPPPHMRALDVGAAVPAQP